MGFRFRKSIGLGNGAKLNLGKSSASVSFGTKGARMSFNSRGRKTTSIGIPGTGISHVSTSTIGGSGKSSPNKAPSSHSGGGKGFWTYFLYFLGICLFISIIRYLWFVILIPLIIYYFVSKKDKQYKNKILIIGGSICLVSVIIFIALGGFNTNDSSGSASSLSSTLTSTTVASKTSSNVSSNLTSSNAVSAKEVISSLQTSSASMESTDPAVIENSAAAISETVPAVVDNNTIAASEKAPAAESKPKETQVVPAPANNTTSIQLGSVTSPVARNETATLSVKGSPNTEYSISVYYSSGAATAEGLEKKQSDANGNVSWSWKVGGKTKAGEHKIVISGGGQKFETSFVTQ